MLDEGWKRKTEALIEQIVEELKRAEIECAGSCGAGCEIAVQDLITKLNVLRKEV